MDQKQIDRINELARKAKSPAGLTECEEAERAAAVLKTAYAQTYVAEPVKKFVRAV